MIFEFANGMRGVLNGNRLADHVANNQRLTMGEARIEGSAGTLTLNGNAEVHFRKKKRLAGKNKKRLCKKEGVDYTT